MTAPIPSRAPTLRPVRRDWLAKTLAGALLGLLLALGCSALFVALAVGIQPSARAQLAMWLVIPVWMGVLSGSYFFTSGLRAWGWLVVSNLAVLGLLAVLRGG